MANRLDSVTQGSKKNIFLDDTRVTPSGFDLSFRTGGRSLELPARQSWRKLRDRVVKEIALSGLVIDSMFRVEGSVMKIIGPGE